MLNNQNIQNNGPQIKLQVLAKWNKLSEAEVEKTHGNVASLLKLVQNKYGSIPDFNKTYEKICESVTPSSKNINKVKQSFQVQADGFNDIENRDPKTPSAEAGMPGPVISEPSFNEQMQMDAPEERLNSGYAKFDGLANINREADDELSAYTTSHLDVDQFEYDKYQEQKDSEKADIKFTTPDDFSHYQDPSLNSEDIPLGRYISSATKIPTAKAAPNSSEVSSNDAKKKM